MSIFDDDDTLKLPIKNAGYSVNFASIGWRNRIKLCWHILRGKPTTIDKVDASVTVRVGEWTDLLNGRLAKAYYLLKVRFHYAMSEGWNCQAKLEYTVRRLCEIFEVAPHKHGALVEHLAGLKKGHGAERSEAKVDPNAETATGIDPFPVTQASA